MICTRGPPLTHQLHTNCNPKTKSWDVKILPCVSSDQRHEDNFVANFWYFFYDQPFLKKMIVSMTTTLWTCSINPFDKSSTKCTEDRCYRWDIWGSPNACKSCAATFLQIPLMHFFPLSAKSLYPMPGERGTKCEIFRLFLPSGRNILSDIVSSCHLSGTAATIYFAILRPNPVPRSFPCHWSGPPVPPNSGNPPLTLEKGTKKLLHLPPAPPSPSKKEETKKAKERN